MIKNIRMETCFDTTIIWKKKKRNNEKSGALHTQKRTAKQFSVKITCGSSNELEKLSAHVSTLTIFLRGGS